MTSYSIEDGLRLLALLGEQEADEERVEREAREREMSSLVIEGREFAGGEEEDAA